MGKDGKRVGKTAPPRSMRSKSRLDQRWWWIGGAAALALVGVVVIWIVAGPGGGPFSQLAAPDAEETAPAVTPSPAQPEDTDPSEEPAAPAEPGEPMERDTSTMPENTVERNDMYTAPPDMKIDPGVTYVAAIVTEKGEIVVELDPGAAPLTVNNFVYLANAGFYDGLTFHRVVPGFVIQGGDPLGTGTGGPGYQVPAEIDLPHVKGAIAMARRPDEVNPEQASSGSQFYITLEPTPQLDGAYTVFGEVVEGTDVVDAIAVDDVIESIVISEQ